MYLPDTDPQKDLGRHVILQLSNFFDRNPQYRQNTKTFLEV